MSRGVTSKVIRVVAAVIMLLLSIEAIWQFILNFSTVVKEIVALYWIWIGALMYGIVRLIDLKFIKSESQLISTFTHELTHAIFALLFFKRVSNFKAGASGRGSISIKKTDNPLIMLSPYSVPIYTLTLLIFRNFIENPTLIYFDITIGFSLAFHIYHFIKTAKPYQFDIRHQGVIFSYISIAFIGVVSIIVIYSTLLGSIDRALDLFIDIFSTTYYRVADSAKEV